MARSTQARSNRTQRFVPASDAPLAVPTNARPDQSYEPVEDLSVESTPDGLIVLHQNGERICMLPNQAARWADMIRAEARRAGALA